MAFKKKPEIITLIFIASLILSMSMVVAREAQASKWIECDDDPCHQPTVSPPSTPGSGDHGGARGHYDPPPPKSEGPQYTYPPPPSDSSSAGRRGRRGYYGPPPPKFQGPYYYTHPPPSPSDNNCTTPDPPNPIMPYYPYYYNRASPTASSAVSIPGTTAMLLSFVMLVG